MITIDVYRLFLLEFSLDCLKLEVVDPAMRENIFVEYWKRYSNYIPSKESRQVLKILSVQNSPDTQTEQRARGRPQIYKGIIFRRSCIKIGGTRQLLIRDFREKTETLPINVEDR